MKATAFLFLFALCSAHALPPIETLNERDAADAWNQWANESKAHWNSTLAATGSMEPVYTAGDYILCEMYAGQEIHVGDLVVFARWDKPLVAHEVIAVSATQFKTKGRACMFSDGWYPYCRIKYIVRRVVRVTAG